VKTIRLEYWGWTYGTDKLFLFTIMFFPAWRRRETRCIAVQQPGMRPLASIWCRALWCALSARYLGTGKSYMWSSLSNLYLLFVCIYCLYYVPIVFTWRRTTFYLGAGRLARNQQPEGHANGHLDTGFSWFSWVLEQMLVWFPFSFPSCHYMLPM
jgi:hypothetical protein